WDSARGRESGRGRGDVARRAHRDERKRAGSLAQRLPLCYCRGSLTGGKLMKKAWGYVTLAVMAAGWACGAFAQQADADSRYPQRPVRFICPYVPGGAGDIFTRTIAQKLTDALGQSVIVDNRPGANGGIGTGIVAKALPDGYTLLMGNSGPMT